MCLAPYEVTELSSRTDWHGVTLDDSAKFMRGCGLNLEHAQSLRRVTDYLSKRPTFRYLRTSPQWASYYQPLLKRWRCAYPVNPPQDLAPHIRALLIRLTPLLK